MYQPMPNEFAVAAVRTRRLNRLLHVMLALLAVLAIGIATFAWSRILCGTCAAPIVCAKQCPRLDRQIEQMLRQQQLLTQPKSTDRIEQQ